MVIKVYTTRICPNCKKVKEFLTAEGVAYEEVDITTAEALTELRMHGVFTLVTPILQVGSTFLTYNDLFSGDELRKEKIKEVIMGVKDEKKS
ncbi:MAG: glutaredoxin family protein [Candidatus Methanospirareceae archaeon]